MLIKYLLLLVVVGTQGAKQMFGICLVPQTCISLQPNSTVLKQGLSAESWCPQRGGLQLSSQAILLSQNSPPRKHYLQYSVHIQPHNRTNGAPWAVLARENDMERKAEATFLYDMVLVQTVLWHACKLCLKLVIFGCKLLKFRFWGPQTRLMQNIASSTALRCVFSTGLRAILASLQGKKHWHLVL